MLFAVSDEVWISVVSSVTMILMLFVKDHLDKQRDTATKAAAKLEAEAVKVKLNETTIRQDQHLVRQDEKLDTVTKEVVETKVQATAAHTAANSLSEKIVHAERLAAGLAATVTERARADRDAELMALGAARATVPPPLPAATLTSSGKAANGAGHAPGLPADVKEIKSDVKEVKLDVKEVVKEVVKETVKEVAANPPKPRSP